MGVIGGGGGGGEGDYGGVVAAADFAAGVVVEEGGLDDEEGSLEGGGGGGAVADAVEDRTGHLIGGMVRCRCVLGGGLGGEGRTRVPARGCLAVGSGGARGISGRTVEECAVGAHCCC